MHDPADVIGVQMCDDDLAKSPPAGDKSIDSHIELRLLIGIRRTRIDHDHLVASDEITVGMSCGWNRRRSEGTKEKPIPKLDPLLQMISLDLRNAIHPFCKIVNTFSHRLQ